jgi:hypothetical protein
MYHDMQFLVHTIQGIIKLLDPDKTSTIYTYQGVLTLLYNGLPYCLWAFQAPSTIYVASILVADR